MTLLVNIVAFKMAWISSVLGAANGLPQLGPAIVMLVIIIHLKNSFNPSLEIAVIVLTGLIGSSWDSLLLASGWLSYPSGTLVPGLAPYWLIAMWLSFATTLNVALRWLQSRLVLASAIGGLLGPVSYYFGSRLGAVVFTNPTGALTALAVGWAILLPLLLMLAKRLDTGEPGHN